MPTPLYLRTRVYPFARERGPRRKWFYRVFVFRNKEVMYAFRREQHRLNPEGISYRADRYEAIASYWWAETRGRHERCIGQILFHVGFIGGGIVAHEMTHAALYAVAHRVKKGYVLTANQDEKLADCVGQMTGKFWRAWYRWKERGWVK